MTQRHYLVVRLPVRTGTAAHGIEHAIVRLDDDNDPGTVDCITWSAFQAAVIAVTFRRYTEAGVLP